MAEPDARVRLDKWLWHARFCKTRAMSAQLVTRSRVRVNGAEVGKPSHPIGPGDTLTFPQGHAIRIVRVVAIGTRRGPAAEAQSLYEDLAQPQEQ